VRAGRRHVALCLEGNSRGSRAAAGAGLLVALLLAVAVAAALEDPQRAAGAPPQTLAKPAPGGGGSGTELSATIRRTSYGIPHIVAGDWASLGFGYGYAFAQDNICTIADSYVTVRGQRSRFFGPDGDYLIGGNGNVVNNLNSDFFFQRINQEGVIEELLDRPPPHGPRPEIKQGVRGYVAGYNHYLRQTGVANIPDPRCRGEEWVTEIKQIDVYRRFYQLVLLASQATAIDGIASAQPPTPPLGSAPAQPSEIDPREWPFPLETGSNAYGLGREATASGRGMVLGNPHFPWDGSERFYQSHLTIPGELNVAGASLFGVPLILIGHTDNLGWSHTVSTAYRFTPFELKLVPGSPTTYVYDGQPREMKRDVVTVRALNDRGRLEERTRTLYSSHHGPIFTELLGNELFPWTPTTAYAMGDANADNFRILNHFFETNQAQSVRELRDILVRNQGIPWVNTIAADSSGEAFYADISVVPHVTDEQAHVCNTPLGQATFQALRLPVLDGARSSCEWESDGDAVVDGIFGPGNLPSLFRADYVTNSNDSYWLSNPEEPLEGFDRIIGDERTPRSLRTRSGLVMVEERLTGTDGRDGNRFTLAQLQESMFDNQQHAGRLFRDDLVAMCHQSPVIVTRNGPVDVFEACPVLEGWDLRDDLDSSGALLFRRFVTRVLHGTTGANAPQTIYRRQFDPGDPVHTPSGLNTENPEVREALGLAVDELRNCGIPLDAGLRGYQYDTRAGGEQIPVHGGPGTLGIFNAINVGWDADRCAYPNVPHGSSFVMAVEFTGEPGCGADPRTILTYSQSENPASPYYLDQTRLFTDKQWVETPFCEPEIAADPALQVTEVTGSAR
jgi:acyl-homoserine-lactone acylase